MWLPYSSTRLQGQNLYLEGLVRFLVVSPAARTAEGSCTPTATAHEGEPSWGPPPLQELLTLIKALLGPALSEVIQLHMCSAAAVKQGT